MRTLLELRDEIQDHPDWNTNQKEFVAIDTMRGIVFNGHFLDPYFNLIECTSIPKLKGKGIYYQDSELDKIQAEFI